MTEQVTLWAVKQRHCSENDRWPAVIYTCSSADSTLQYRALYGVMWPCMA